MAVIVEDGVTGLHFTPGDAQDLAAKVRWAVNHTDEMRRMGANARRDYEDKYTPATKTLGWEPKVRLDDGLAKMIAYFEDLLCEAS